MGECQIEAITGLEQSLAEDRPRPRRQTRVPPDPRDAQAGNRAALDIYTPDEVLEQGFDAAAKAKAAGLVQAFRNYLKQNQAQIDALVRVALEKQPVLAPFADSVSERFHEWLREKQSGSGVPPHISEEAKRQDAASTPFTPEQLTWLGLIRDRIATASALTPRISNTPTSASAVDWARRISCSVSNSPGYSTS
jgi:type I restriction enzyme R subunit